MSDYIEYIEPSEITKGLADAIEHTRAEIRKAFRTELPQEPSAEAKRRIIAQLRAEERQNRLPTPSPQ